MRISRPQMFMDIAHVVAKRGTCQRLSVGAVLVYKRSIVSIGYNGVASGLPHCIGNHCPGKFGCDIAIHAEINAMLHLPEKTVAPLDLYVTDSPCEECWEYLIYDGRVERVFFGTPYRIREMIGRHSPRVFRITPSGYIMDWHTKLLCEPVT